MTALPIGIAVVTTAEGTRHYVTVSSPDTAFTQGLIGEAIVGALRRPPGDNEAITPDNFVGNPVFTKFVNEVIAKYGPQQPGLQSEAKRIGTGHVAVVDLRARDPASAPPEDIFGAFVIADGKVESYVASPNHQLLTTDGFFKLDAALNECLLQELGARVAAAKPPAG